MPKVSPEPLQKHTLNLYEGDFDALSALYPDAGGSLVIRELVRAAIRNAKSNDPKVKIEGLELKL